MEPISILNDGRVVSLGRDYVDGDLVNVVRIFAENGFELTSNSVAYAAGTPVGEPGSNAEILGAFLAPDGSVRIVARDSFAEKAWTFDLGATGEILGSTELATPQGDINSPFLSVQPGLIQAPNGTLVSLWGQYLYLASPDGAYLTETRPDTRHSSSADDAIITSGGRILRATLIQPDTEVQIEAQFYELDGTPVADPFIVAGGLSSVFGHFDVELAELIDGRVAVVYSTSRDGDADTSEAAVYMTILNADGTVSVAEQMVNTDDTDGAQDWVGVHPLSNGGVAVTYGTETGFTRTESQNARFFDSSGMEYDSYQQLGQRGRPAESLYVSPDGVLYRLDPRETDRLYDAPNPDDPGLVGDEIMLSKGTLGELAEDAEIATLADGRVVVTYDHTNLEGHIRIYDPANGSLTDVDTVSVARESSVAGLADGGFVVAWRTSDQRANEDLRIQIHNADGSVRLAETVVFDGETEHVAVAATRSGFVLTYTDDEGVADDQLMVQFFGAGGASQGTAFAMEDTIFETVNVADAVLMGDGRLAMVWHSKHRTNFEANIKLMIFDTTGARAFAEPIVVSDDERAWQPPRIVGLDDGGFAVVHVNSENKFILSQYSATGALVRTGVELITEQAINPGDNLNLSSSHSQVYDIEMTGDGQLVLAYVVTTGDRTDGTDVRYAIFELDGQVVLDSRAATENLADDQDSVELTRLPDGTVFLSFSDDTNIRFSSQQSINGVRIQGGEKPETPLPTPGPDFIFGTDGDDVIDLLDGDDRYMGDSGNDSISGNSGEDLLDGGDGNDTLSGGGNDDTIRGGAGDDTSVFAGTSTAATVREATGGLLVHSRDGTDFVRDDVENFQFDDTVLSYAQMEALVGRPAPDVTGSDDAEELFGTALTERILALGGDDVIFPGTGSDTIDGGSGIDRVDFSMQPLVLGWTILDYMLEVTLGTGVADIFGDDVKTLEGVENVIGTAWSDSLAGDVLGNVLAGLDGNDRLVGLEGDDTLDGGVGADTLNGGDGDDRISGGPDGHEADQRDVIYAGAGDDRAEGGGGNDQIFGQEGNDTLAGGFGADELQGQDGDDVVTGGALSDLVFGGNGNDFVNGGFGYDRINGGAGADSFFHLGVADHGSDWVQDYLAGDGDVLVFGQAATAADFQINLAHTATPDGERSGEDAVQEAFVIYRPTGQIMWALVDGEAQLNINIQIGGEIFDLLA
ncbi:calcium-binding protein [Lutimaribacter marinistellae]|uniref:Calcium-binding protein n=1 Tax=Lutimaribacter marinistellae TaxID=1820329 RepID=A0ABV7TPD2_9RHOB